MSLSECLKCGGHIPLGPHASNRCESCGAGVLEPAAPSTGTLGTPANPYRAHLRHVTNELHRKLTGCRTGTSAYKGLYGRWCQAQEDLAAYEQIEGGGEPLGGLGQSGG